MKSTGTLRAITIIAIILGALGLFSGLSSLATLAVGAEKIQAMVPVPGQTARVAEVQAEMNRAILALTAEWKTYSTVLVALHVLIASWLLAGGIMTLKLRERGRQILGMVFIAAIPMEILRGVASVSISLETMRIVREWTPRLVQANTAPGAKTPPGFDGIMSGVMSASAMVGLAFGVGWIVLQIGFYIVGALHLRKPDVRALFRAS